MKAIVAMSENRIIGSSGAIPWHLPEDFKFFKATTLGHTIVMGRKTYESIGKPLPGRTNVVISRTLSNIPGATVVSHPECISTSDQYHNAFVIGGEEIYRSLLPFVQELYVTKVHRNVTGDAVFPEFESCFDTGEILLKTPDFTIFKFLRVGP
jgi:dihydrofolate reductase